MTKVDRNMMVDDLMKEERKIGPGKPFGIWRGKRIITWGGGYGGWRSWNIDLLNALEATGEVTHRDLGLLNSIEMVDKDELPSGLFAREQMSHAGDIRPKWGYETYRKLKESPLRGPGYFFGRFKHARNIKGWIATSEQFIKGNTITIRLWYVREDPGNRTRPLTRIQGDKPSKSIYLWGQTPHNLKPGTYTINIELDEYERRNGQLARALKTRFVLNERLSCNYVVPDPAAKKPADPEATTIWVLPDGTYRFGIRSAATNL